MPRTIVFDKEGEAERAELLRGSLTPARPNAEDKPATESMKIPYGQVSQEMLLRSLTVRSPVLAGVDTMKPIRSPERGT